VENIAANETSFVFTTIIVGVSRFFANNGWYDLQPQKIIEISTKAAIHFKFERSTTTVNSSRAQTN
jgi:hypothetical protein